MAVPGRIWLVRGDSSVSVQAYAYFLYFRNRIRGQSARSLRYAARRRVLWPTTK